MSQEIATTNDFDQTHRAGPWLIWLAALLLFGSVVGCSGGTSSGIPIQGTITLDNNALPNGTITFATTDGRSIGTAEIRDGQYAIPASAGLQEGTYQVEIISVVPTGKTVKNPDIPGETIDEVRNVIPARYNVQSELKAELKAASPRELPFSLSSSKVATRNNRRPS